MNIYQLLETILEELADGRKEGESIEDYKGRKAEELEKYFHDKVEQADKVCNVLDKKAAKARGVYRKNPNLETVNAWNDAQSKALDKRLQKGSLYNKEWRAHKINSWAKWKKKNKYNEALEIMEEILNVVEGKNLDAVIDRAKKGSYEQRRVLQNKYGEEADWTDNLKHPDAHIERVRQKEGKDAAGAEVLKGVSAKVPDSKTYKVNKRSKGAKNVFSKTNFTDTTDTNIGNIDSTLLGSAASDRRQTNKAIGRHYRKLNKTHEALDLMEQIVDFADNLFELDYEEKQNISPNKVSRVKKDKNGEKVEVVSVADELFPYEGDAKQQFNQKVLAKINDMIEGTGSLEDLIQFVRKGVAAKKQSVHESLDEEKKKLSDIKTKMTGCKETKVAENLNDQIDKKLKKGEIDIDKAFKLAQKIQNEMSTAKKGEEYMAVLNKRAKKERLDDKAIAKSIRRNEKSKWQTK